MLDTAIIGMGGWGQKLVASVQGNNAAGLRFVSGATGRPERAADFAKANDIRLEPSFEAVLADPSVKAVVLATPHKAHAAQVIAAARAGKHVFVEKPFTMSKASAEEAVEACAKAGVVLALGHNRRFLPSTMDIKALVEAGELGTMLHVEGHISGPGAIAYKAGMWRADRSESPLGGMGGMGIHMIDMMVHLAGPIAAVTVRSLARVLDNGLDDTTAGLFRFASGATGSFATLAYAPRYWRVALFGDRAHVEMRGQEQVIFTPREGKGWVRDYPATDIERAELTAFATAVADGAAYPLPVAEAIHGASVFETMVFAAEAGGEYAVP
ncbi:MAG: Oxidoreductase [Rhodospirillales bacterium]|nr:Oxidoreductase [Rhodospirillales bacterium]MDB5380933.1 Oxidoreductase [Rhodospirillales bacterium]